MASQRVDVHHHFVPSFYVRALQEGGGDPSGWKVPDWTLDKDLQFNDEEGIAFTLLSITAPGADILPLSKQASFCREANEFAAHVRSTHPTRYGFFASIPSLLDPASAHSELTYALDTLHADGVILYTRYGSDNHYLGHPDFRFTWDLLDSRGTVVFVHPTHPVDTALVDPFLPQPMIDYPHETTRAAVDLIVSDTLRSHPNVKVILSHAGGSLPYLALRPAAMLPYIPSAEGADGHKKSTRDFLEEARSFYFDTALSSSHLTLELLKGFAKPGHVLFGSDFPYAPTPAIRLMNKLVNDYEKKEAAYARAINTSAAVALFPRLAKVLDTGAKSV
ncbi:uncharacterized protein K452DRAFT_281193 [Aplosporella prunicola CBS 121167]|uniref:6-methylsalicylate decarboxylase n=1 Tax=Aplosporella prunicola CBS 121167 TaxID=1176127 RepID=A0A6A6AVE9_9PEZI|nr:uncharacterized protein K452DRAFT_281193 [Aplosporella prunicola CBS 121167]KAF2135650.1 hypothetical protein K452DRAFT_281193 [Aplosporella prunicola CBS 121167]